MFRGRTIVNSDLLSVHISNVLFFSVIYGYFVSTKLAPTLAPENG
jgi:hypothetical protein